MKKPTPFFLTLIFLLGIAFLIRDNYLLAMWFGFAIAGYSAIANDSIQTLGAFLSSNSKKTWILQWLFMGGIFIISTIWSWENYNGDVSHQRLLAKGFERAPQSFTYLQLAAPILLLALTRYRIPVSTTFLLLSCFATTPAAIGSMTMKSVMGYVIAFVLAFIVWNVAQRIAQRIGEVNAQNPIWIPIQWLATGLLWSVWLMQDMANVAVFLPRSLNYEELIFFIVFIFSGLGILFYKRGEAIQKVVEEKSNLDRVTSATFLVIVYAIILWVFKIHSKIPMSTTWVFIGLLAGRELALHSKEKKAKKMIRRDLAAVFIGFAFSIFLAFMSNPSMTF